MLITDINNKQLKHINNRQQSYPWFQIMIKYAGCPFHVSYMFFSWTIQAFLVHYTYSFHLLYMHFLNTIHACSMRHALFMYYTCSFHALYKHVSCIVCALFMHYMCTFIYCTLSWHALYMLSECIYIHSAVCRVNRLFSREKHIMTILEHCTMTIQQDWCIIIKK